MNQQGKLFETQSTRDSRPAAVGQAAVSYETVASILTRASGFMSGYDFSLNPYSGCTFGCTYCYAAFFARSEEKRDTWGRWVVVKDNATALLQKLKPGTLDGKAIYASSVTDPYQPIESKLGLTRNILEILAANHKPRLVIQTRSPLVTRDIDVLKRFEKLAVNMTITTDSETVRRAFEPLCPSNRDRLTAIRAVREAGLNALITMTPLLPVEDPARFADSLLATGVQSFVAQPFHPTRGKFVRGTREGAQLILRDYGWTERRYAEVLNILSTRLPALKIGQAGFAPPD